MIRGAFILAVGFSLGYAKALHDQEDIRNGLVELIDLLKTSVPNPPETVDGTAREVSDNETPEGEDDNHE